MILQALYELAQSEGLMEDPDFERKPVAWLVRVDKGGRLLGIEGTHEVAPSSPSGRKKPPKPVPKRFIVPRESSRTSRARAMFLYDKAEYVFGIDPAGERPKAKLTARLSLFRDGVKKCLDTTRDEGVKAVNEFLENVESGRQPVTLPKDCATNDLFAFIYAPDQDRLVTQREAVRKYWQAVRASGTGGTAGQANASRCLVSGAPCTPVDKHPPIKRVPGGTTSGIALVSFNSAAFESYGWGRNENAPISREAAEACSTALNRLLDYSPQAPDGRLLPRLHFVLSSDTVVCYWAPHAKSGDLLACLGAIFEADPTAVGEVYRSLWRGKPPAITDPSAFYALTLSGAQGRAIVRDWFESTVAEVADHLAQHFADLAIVRNTPKPRDHDLPPHIPLRVLLRSLAPQGKDDAIPAPLAAELVEAALRGTPYPFSLLQRALERARAEIGDVDKAKTPLDRHRALEARDARAALIKAVLNRRRQTTINYKEVTRDMDPTNNNPGYLLGRLMAVIERMQQAASPEVNTTVVDRFFCGASATPAVVFPRLLRNMRHHASKAKDDKRGAGTAKWLEGQADAIVSGLNGFPAFLPLEEQGLFVLGYHHQRHWLWMSKEARDKEQADQAEPAAARS